MEREVSEVDRKLLLKKTYLDKINYHITRNPLNQEEIYSLVRHFFGEFLKLDYEFTYEELSQELNKVFIRPKVKEHIDNFLIRLSESEYLEENALGSVEINAFLSELADIIMNVISEEQAAAHEESSLISRILKHKVKDTRMEDMVHINTMIDELNFHITSGNLDSSKRLYVDILKIYDGLRREDKKALHESMNDVYERLQVLMKNPKGGIAAVGQSTTSTAGVSQPRQQAVSDAAKKVMDYADDTEYYIDASNLEMAKKQYNETMKLYDALKHEEKQVLHPRLNDLYSRIQSLSADIQESTDIQASAKAVSASKDHKKSRDAFKDKDPSRMSGSAGTGIVAVTAEPAIDNQASGLPELPLASVPMADGTGREIEPEWSEEDRMSPKISITGDVSVSADDTKEASTTGGFDFSIDTSAGNGQSLVDEDIDVYRRPIVEDTEQIAALNKLIGERSEDAESSDTAEVISEGKSRKKSGSLKKAMPATASSQASSQFMEPDAEDTNVHTDISGLSNAKSLSGNVLLFIPEESSGPTSSTSLSPGPSSGSLSGPSSGISTGPLSASAGSLSASLPSKEPRTGSIGTIKGRATVAETDAKTRPAEILKTDIPAIPKKGLSPEKDISIAAVDAAKHQIKQPQKPEMKKAVKESKAEIVRHSDKLLSLLNRINDDIIMEKLDKAKSSYKEALILYRSMKDAEKASCYDRFYATFKGLDKALHQKSLHNLLESHLSESVNSQRPVAAMKPQEQGQYVPESSKIAKNTTLPMVLSADEYTTRIYELIEESYFNMANNNHDIAMLKYFKALEAYHSIPAKDKKVAYRDLYELFKRLSMLKNAVRQG